MSTEEVLELGCYIVKDRVVKIQCHFANVITNAMKWDLYLHLRVDLHQDLGSRNLGVMTLFRWTLQSYTKIGSTVEEWFSNQKEFFSSVRTNDIWKESDATLAPLCI